MGSGLSPRAPHAVLFLLCLALRDTAYAAVAKDRVTTLPGWEGPLPSAHYSGFVPLDGGRNVHCASMASGVVHCQWRSA